MDKKYKELAKKARIDVLGMIYKAQTSHIASNFSVIDIATVLYENLKEGDEVFWSKGWVAASIYYFLAKQGKIPKEDLEKFPNAPYLALAETKVNGVLVSGGSMGHGLPVAVGVALGKKKSGEKGIVYCIMGDGEMQEGTTWEAAQIAAHHKLNNLIVLVDYNKWCAMGKVNDVCNLEPFEDRWLGFNWKVQRVNGHDYGQIEEALTTDFTSETFFEIPGPVSQGFSPVVDESLKYKPMVIICETIKGKGVSFMENHLLYHYKYIEKEEYEKALKELENA